MFKLRIIDSIDPEFTVYMYATAYIDIVIVTFVTFFVQPYQVSRAMQTGSSGRSAREGAVKGFKGSGPVGCQSQGTSVLLPKGKGIDLCTSFYASHNHIL